MTRSYTMRCKTFQGEGRNTVTLNSNKLLNNIITLFFIQYFYNILTSVNMCGPGLPDSINDSSDANDASNKTPPRLIDRPD